MIRLIKSLNVVLIQTLYEEDDSAVLRLNRSKHKAFTHSSNKVKSDTQHLN